VDAIEREELQTLIPHRGKMFLLGRVTEYDIKGSIRSEYKIESTCLFYDSKINGVPSWAGFEFMAQTVSALSGIRDRILGRKPRMGFILSVPSMRIEIPSFRLGSLLDIRMSECDSTEDIFTYDGEIYIEGTKVMEGRILVMEVKDEQQFLSQFKEEELNN
jgi:predicted hotdog family 3-hydroxylacyl-ACP dehydratase